MQRDANQKTTADLKTTMLKDLVVDILREPMEATEELTLTLAARTEKSLKESLSETREMREGSVRREDLAMEEDMKWRSPSWTDLSRSLKMAPTGETLRVSEAEESGTEGESSETEA